MDLREQLLAMAAHDMEVREQLAVDGSLFNGYHPGMRAVHEANAARLEILLDAHGWPTEQAVGADGAEAAWLIVQHAISRPDLSRRALAELRHHSEAGNVPAWQPAYLEDRIRIFEGRPQVYGTQFDWDENGEMSPVPVEDPAGLAGRREGLGLEPISQAQARLRAEWRAEFRPKDLEQHRREKEDFAHSVGWRD